MNRRSTSMPRADKVLPELCTPPATLTLIVIGVLVAFALAVASAEPGAFWGTLGRLALLCEFLTLASAGSVCLLRRPLAGYTTIIAMGVTFAVLVLVAWGVAEAAWFLIGAYGEAQVQGVGVQAVWVGRIVLVAAIIDALLLRYFYVTAAWRENVRSEAASRLEALTARVRPHFLFNSLNTAAALVRDQPEAAEHTLENLAELFRASLGTRAARVPVADEIEIAKRYLAIEALRLGERLDVDWSIEPDTRTALLPPLLLQTLAENAITHGIELRAKGGTLRIKLWRERANLMLAVGNSLSSGMSEARHGIGLAGARARLQLAFGAKAELVVAETADRFEVRVRCPWVEDGRDDAHSDRR
ncbi:MAG: sensor histidine kinase [Gammaproteobacteria bacterium]